MISKTNTTRLRYLPLILCFSALSFAACNNGSESKDKPADTPMVKEPEVKPADTPAAPIDTSKMKEATTRPVKTSD